MKLGTNEPISILTQEKMSYLKQLGVNYVIVRTSASGGQTESSQWESNLPAKPGRGGYYRIEDLIALKKAVEGRGLELYGVSPTDCLDKAILALPGRDEQIENWCKTLRNVGRAGIPMIQYGWVDNAGAWLSNWRTTARAVGRGGAHLVSFDYEVAKEVPISAFGEITDEMMWDNLTYFLKAVIPVAEESRVKMVMHPADPQVPSLAGIARIIRSVEAYDRLFEIVPSDYNCMLFCLGCFSQMLEPEGVYDAIRHFGTKGKIGSVHFRNVRGNLEKFDEVYPDDGKLDMVEAIRVLHETGYKGTITPDHIPHGALDATGYIGLAFQIGYLKGLLQSASALD